MRTDDTNKINENTFGLREIYTRPQAGVWLLIIRWYNIRVPLNYTI